MSKVVCVIVLFFSLSTIGFCQDEKHIDSLVQVVCEDLGKDNAANFEEKFNKILMKHFATYMQSIDPSEAESVSTFMILRLQKNCDKVAEYLYNLDPGQGDWVKLDEPKESEISKKEQNEFFKKGNFIYLEPNGDEVKVILTKNSWVDNFKNGTNSKLHLKILELGKFELEFIESNNEIRKNMSRKGEKYIYTLISKEPDFYYITVEIPDSDQVFMFKMY